MIANKKNVNIKLERWMVLKLMSACTLIANELDAASFDLIRDVLKIALDQHDKKEEEGR